MKTCIQSAYQFKRMNKVKERTNQTRGNSLKKPKVDFFSGKLRNKGIFSAYKCILFGCIYGDARPDGCGV